MESSYAIRGTLLNDIIHSLNNIPLDTGAK